MQTVAGGVKDRKDQSWGEHWDQEFSSPVTAGRPESVCDGSREGGQGQPGPAFSARQAGSVLFLAQAEAFRGL